MISQLLAGRRGLVAGLWVGLCLVPGPPVEAGSWSLEALMAALARKSVGRVAFVETRRSDFLKTELILRGHLSYTPPDRLEKHVMQPFRERTTVDGDVLQIENLDENRRQRLSLNAYPHLRVFVDSFRATLGGRLDLLRHYYELHLSGDEQAWLLSMVPKAPRMKQAVAQVRVYGRAGRIDRIETDETDGDGSRLELRHSDDPQG